MKRYLLVLFIFLLFILSSCKKDDFESVPENIREGVAASPYYCSGLKEYMDEAIYLGDYFGYGIIYYKKQESHLCHCLVARNYAFCSYDCFYLLAYDYEKKYTIDFFTLCNKGVFNKESGTDYQFFSDEDIKEIYKKFKKIEGPNYSIKYRDFIKNADILLPYHYYEGMY